MSNRVLGNDPFQRTTARRQKTAPAQKSELSQAPETAATPHPDSPTAIPLSHEGATGHAHSPSVVAHIEGVTPHPASPQLLEARDVRARWSVALRRLLKPLSDTPLDPWGRDEELSRLLRPVADFIIQNVVKVKVFNADILPSGPLIIVANHTVAPILDGPLFHHSLAVTRPGLNLSRWLLEDTYLDALWMGPFLQRLGAVRATPDNVLSLLRANHPVVVFPEGNSGPQRTSDGTIRIQHFGRGGYLKLAARASASVVPAAIVGSGPMPLLEKLPSWPFGSMMKLESLPLPSRWTIRFAQPVPLPSNENPDDFRTLNEQVRETIQHLLEQTPGDAP